MKFDYIFWDIDGTMRPGSRESVVFSEIREIISVGPKERHGVISNGHHERQMRFLVETGLDRHLNMALFFSPTLYAEEALVNEKHELRKSAKSLSFEDLRTEASKHKVYLFEKAKEKVGDSSCVMIDDSLMSILSAKRAGFTTIYLIRNDSDKHLIEELGLDVDYVVKIGELYKIKEILGC